MTYGELKLKLYHTYADRHGIICEIPSALYFAVIDIANEAGCEQLAEPCTIIDELSARDFSVACIDAVLAVFRKTTSALVYSA